MKTHILLLKERETCAKLIKTLTKTDQVILLYTEGEDLVSVSDFQMYANAKCKIQFMQAPIKTNIDDNVAIAFLLGKLLGQYPGATIISSDPLIKNLVDGEEIKPKTRQPRTKQSDPAVTEPKNVKIPVSENTVTAPPDKNTAKRHRRTKSQPLAVSKTELKTKPAPAEEDFMPKPTNINADDFDKAYDQLTKYLTSIKTKEVNPAANIGSICQAAKIMDEEKKSFEDAIKVCASSSTARKLLAIEEEKRNGFIELARKVNELDS